MAEELLADWETSLTRFTEVIPRDFRTVMDAKAKAEADGLDERDGDRDDGGFMADRGSWTSASICRTPGTYRKGA